MDNNINNLYNFKNTVRHFVNIENVYYPQEDEILDLKKLSWVEPINFRIRKDNGKYRTLKLPNILNFKNCYNYYKDSPSFNDISCIDEDNHKRLVPDILTGEFRTGVYSERLQEDLENLCVYDNLIRLDIKSYYGRIYAHYIEFDNGKIEKYLTNLNLGSTSGLIMGNYISLYFAEKYLHKISEDIKNKLTEESIGCCFSYFSDDFYFFCNKKDNDKIVQIFNSVLEKYDLERNDGKINTWTYLDYNNYHIIDKYWKKVKSDNEQKNSKHSQYSKYKKFYFINQLIYRISKLNDDKVRRVFLISFFKSKYFYTLDINNYIMESHNYHQLCYIFKFVPEVMMYSIYKFLKFEDIKGEKFKEFLNIRFEESLSKPYNEEQLYYYYTLSLLNYTDILKENIKSVIRGNNQVLISYYLKDGLIDDEEDIDELKSKREERYWFQNYHLILFSNLNNDLEKSIKEYLIPINAKGKSSEESYIEFYKANIERKISFINDIDDITLSVNKFIKLRAWLEDGESTIDNSNDISIEDDIDEI